METTLPRAFLRLVCTKEISRSSELSDLSDWIHFFLEELVGSKV